MNEDRNELMLFCEYTQTPLGIETEAPRFSWQGQGGLANKIQTAYRVVVRNKDTLVWDSGVVHSSKSHAIVYEGAALESAARYHWSVTVWVQGEKEPCQSRETWFETALLHKSDWKNAAWIAHPAPVRGVAPMFRRSFMLEDVPQVARLYLSGLGYAQVAVNGAAVDGSFLDPGWTDYRKTVLYRTWDVSGLLRKGENVLSVVLGEGWYGNDHENFLNLIGSMPAWLSTPKLLCLLQAGDTTLVSGADGQWKVTDGPIRKNNIYDGVWYDARLEKDGWQLPGYVCDHTWDDVVQTEGPAGILRCQQMPYIGKKRMVEPFSISYPDDGDAYEVVADMGVNLSGWAQITAEGKPGQKITLRFAETLNPNGSVNQDNLRGAKATDTFIIGKEGRVTYEPDFTYHGFRYVQVKTDPGVIVTKIRGWQINTLVAQTSSFRCSDDLLNRIYRAILQTEQNNLHSVPTDCPQRDERLAWINDMTVRCEEGLFNFDMARFYEKWLQDIADAQDPITGAIPDTAPYFFGGSPAFHISSVYVLLPWLMYHFYQDPRMIQIHYEDMERYVAFKLSQRDSQGLINANYFGDWAAPMTESLLGWGENAVPLNNPRQLVTTCYLYYDCVLMAKMAKILGLTEKERMYQRLQEEVKHAVNAAYFHEDHYAENAQGSNAFPLFLDMVPEGKRDAVRNSLLEDLFVKRKGRLSTGNQLTKYLYEVFLQEGLHEEAFALATYKGYPSVNYMMECGATTIWERWEKMAGNHMNSHDHPMLGAFTVWFHKGLCGLDPQNVTADGRLVLKPGFVKKLDYVEGSIHIPQGKLALGWEKTETTILIRVEIPWNTFACLQLPAWADGASVDGAYLSIENGLLDLAPGNHQIELQNKNA